MRIERTRVAAPTRLRHAAAFVASPRHLLEPALAVATAALERREPVAHAVSPDTERALHAALGGTALVALSAPHGPDGGSGQTVAARWARELRALGGPAAVLVEHDSRLDGVDGGFWTELDAAVNVALADLPVHLTCFFPEMPLHLEVTAGARRNHPHLLVDGELLHNPDHRCPRDVLGARPAPVPAVLGPPYLELGFGAWQLHDVRAALEEALLAAGYGRVRAEDVVLAVNEVATNAVEHGAAQARLTLWIDGGDVVCEISDTGRLVDPLPGLRAPHPAHPRGRGVWIARQLCDVLHVWADASGTHVRVRAAP